MTITTAVRPVRAIKHAARFNHYRITNALFACGIQKPRGISINDLLGALPKPTLEHLLVLVKD